MKTRTILTSALLALAFVGMHAQDSTLTFKPTGAKKKANGKTTWIVGIHGVAVDDDGETFGKLFDMANSWNYLPYPTRATVEMGLNNKWRVEGSVAYTQYKAGKEINDVISTKANQFVAIDFNAKYDLNALVGETSVFDPYTVSGLGFTYRNGLGNEHNKATPTVNLGLGFNVWIYKGFGLNLQTTAKFKILPKSSNYLMHTAGIVYQIGYVDNSEPKGGSIRPVR